MKETRKGVLWQVLMTVLCAFISASFFRAGISENQSCIWQYVFYVGTIWFAFQFFCYMEETIKKYLRYRVQQQESGKE